MLKHLVFFSVGISLIFILLIGVLVVPSPVHAASWWNSNWLFKKQITFNNSAQAENLTNFPVLVKLSSSNFNFSKAQSHGEDIRFVDGDDATTIPYEIEKWDSANQQAFIWVKVPQIDASSSTDSIYMYYGSSSATDGQYQTGTWNSNYKAVWHLKETGNGTAAEYKDSTSNGNNGQGGQGTTSQVPTPITGGQIDGAQSFTQANNSNIYASNPMYQSTDSVTLTGWVYLGSNMAGRWLFGSDLTMDMQYNSNTFGFKLSGGANNYFASSPTNPDNRWHYVGASYNSSARTYVIYVDGVSAASGASLDTPQTYSNTSTYFCIGGSIAIGGVCPGGGVVTAAMDEVRVSNTVRSANWIAAEYKNGIDTFSSYGNEQSGTGPTLTLNNSTGVGNAGKTRITGKMNSGNSSFNVTNVECAVNGDGFASATPTDGSFNSSNEDFYCDFFQNDNSWSGSGFSVRARGYLGGGPIVDNVMYFTPLTLTQPSSTTSIPIPTVTSSPTVSFSVINQPKVLTDNISKYQIQAKWGDNNSKAPWLTVLDNIPVSGILDTNGQLSVTTDQFKATYSNVDGGPGSNIKNDTSISVNPKIPILTGNSSNIYTLRIIAQDKSGHGLESNTTTVKATPSVLPLKAITPGFPLAILNISGYGNPRLSSLDLPTSIPTYNLSSSNPIFYGIAFASANISLQLTEGVNTKTYTTIANNQSRFGINIPKGDLISGKTYSAILSATLNSQYTQLAFNIN